MWRARIYTRIYRNDPGKPISHFAMACVCECADTIARALCGNVRRDCAGIF